MAYKLSIADKVIVPMKFQQKDGKVLKSFDFTLICHRLTDDEFQRSIRDENKVTTNEKIKETFLAITTNWEKQTLVLDDDGQPAEFCIEALEVMYGAVGVLDLAVSSYMKETAAKGKN